MATEIDEVHDADAAKDQLGHTSKTVTERLAPRIDEGTLVPVVTPAPG